MDFMTFLVLLIISAIVSGVMHYGLHYYVTPGPDSFVSKVVVGWVGALLGTRMLGQWWESLSYGDVYFIPALLGSAAVLVFAVDFVKSWGTVLRART